MQNSLAAKTTICGFVFVSDVTSQTGGGGEGALTLVTRELLQSLHDTSAKTFKAALKNSQCSQIIHFRQTGALPDLAVLISHMMNVVFPVCVACVARCTLPT